MQEEEITARVCESCGNELLNYPVEAVICNDCLMEEEDNQE
jgi:hypothetical protein